MDKTFEPAAVEARIASLWDEAGAFRAGRPERAGAEPYCIVIPPPNVTGSLHMGHALNNTLQDVLCRFERMRGKDVLWQPGMDHAGIATQMVVERQLAERGEPGRRELGREAFLERVWQWKAESGSTITNQLKRLGASCDWSRERFTMDEGLSRAVNKVFVDLHRQGFIYRDKRLVNWDPRFQTAISDLEVVQVETKGHLWHFKYPLAAEPERFITVATTRPETMLGDVAIAVNPDDERYQDLIGRMVELPLVGRLIPIVADSYSDPEKGTGAVKITPAHDFNDFEVGRRHDLRVINILDAEGRLDLRHNAAFLEEADSAELDAVMALHGQDRFEARKAIVAMMDERGLLATIEPHTHMVPHGDRSGVIIEPFLTDQWYVNVKPLAERALEKVREGQTRFIPANWEKTFFQWLENIEPWCVSRQLWWGHQIPAWYTPDGEVYVGESFEDVLPAALAAAVERGVLEPAQAEAFAADPSSAANFLVRDEDVLDTWFSSGLWPFSTLGWPDDTPEFKRFYPTATLVTGFDIIFFWVARMMMLGLFVTDDVPFINVYLHALVRDEKGAKMSKSKGNVIDPLDLMDRYGTDALRFTLAAMAAQGRDIKLAPQRVEGYRNFASKLWNAARFAEMNGCVRDASFDVSLVREPLNLWVLGEAGKAVDEVTVALEAFRFNDAANSAYRFVWNVYCDWYLELTKPALQGEDGAAKQEVRAVVSYVLDQICKLLHPFMPFLTEELWGVTAEAAGGRDSILALAPWPAAPNVDARLVAAAEAELGWIVELVSDIRSARAETNVPAGAKAPLVMVNVDDETRRIVLANTARIQVLGRVSDISFAAAVEGRAIQLQVRGQNAAIPLEGVIDFDAERARLAKEIDKLANDIRKIEAKLANADFLARAPEEVVVEQKERLAEASERRDRLGEALARLT